METNVQERGTNSMKNPELMEFQKLMQEVAMLPKEQREKVSIFAQGFMVGNVSREK